MIEDLLVLDHFGLKNYQTNVYLYGLQWIPTLKQPENESGCSSPSTAKV
jgi:hypothetical protein